MKSERKFIIKVTAIDPNVKIGYISYVIKNFLGYTFQKTQKKEKAYYWLYKKSCEKIIKKLETQIDPTKLNIINKYKFEIEEITDKKTLRKIKLKRLRKK